MGATHKLLVLLAVAGAAMVAAPESALAQETPIEVVHADTGEPCNPCSIEAIGESVYRTSMGTVALSCEDHLEGEIYHDGTGHITSYNPVTHTAGGCSNLQTCTGVPEGPGEGEWPITELGETSPNLAHFHMNLCRESASDPDSTGDHCLVEFVISEPTLHQYMLSAHQVCPLVGFTFEFEAEWALTDAGGTHDAIELTHL